MFYERVPIHPMYGTTPAQIFDLYGIPRRQDALSYVMDLPQNQSLRQSIQGAVGLDTDLLRVSRSNVPGGETFCLPIDIGVVHSIRPDVNMQGVQPRGHLLTPKMTHAVHVRFHLTFGNNTPWRAIGDALRCKRIRWVQTVKKKNNPYPGPNVFVDGGGTEREIHPNQGDLMNVPWYDQNDHYYSKLSGSAVERVELTDTPGGPEAKTATSGLYFWATTSAAVWTGKRVTLIRSFSWNFHILPGKDKKAVEHSPILPATPDEIREHLRILKDIHQNNVCTNRPHQPPACLQTGGDLNYRPMPANGSINEGM